MESIPDLLPCAPIRPPAPYIGGKRRLAARIIERQRLIPHAVYVEVFLGMGGVFLRRPWRTRSEVINDLSSDVATLFRVLQHHYEALMDVLRWQVTSREAFERLRAAEPDTLTDLHRAARFLYLQRVAYGGKVTGRSFGIDVKTPGRFDVTKLAPMLAEIHDRLAGVVIERLPYAELLRRYDHPATLFYLDPPYAGSEDTYGQPFAAADFALLADLLRQVRGRWLLSINDTPEIRETFAGAHLEEATLLYSISGGSGVTARELILSGGGGRGLSQRTLKRP